MFLTLQRIKKSFGQGESKVEVLKGIDLAVEQGEFCVLLGPSGSGKSTLLNIIGGIDRADDGEIVIHGERMADMKEKRLTIYRRKHLGYIFQMYNLIPNLTVRENIEVGAYLSDKPLDVNELLHTLGLYSGRLRHHARYGIQDCCGIAAGITDRTCLIADRNSTVTGRQQSVRSRYGSVWRRNPAAVSGIRSTASGKRTTFFHRNCPDRRFGYDDLRHGQPASGTGQI